MKCSSCSYQFDRIKEGNLNKRKCGMCCFGDSYSIRSKKEYGRNLVFAVIESQQLGAILLLYYFYLYFLS